MMQKSKEFLMVGVGELLWDVLPEKKVLGGAPANFAYHANQLGNRGVIISSIGTDENGENILSTLEQMNIEHCLSQQEKYPTGHVSVMLNGNGIPSYTIHEDVAWDYLKLDDQQEKLAGETDVVCFGTLAQRNAMSADAINSFLGSTSRECIRLLDLNLRENYYDRAKVEELLEIANVVKLNDEELLTVAEYFHLFGSETAMLEQLESLFSLDLIILTKGGDGSRLFSSERGDSIFNGVPLKIVDTVGAGDAFTAAVATGICRKMEMQDIHLLATRVAAYVCQQPGATPKLPSIETLLAK